MPERAGAHERLQGKSVLRVFFVAACFVVVLFVTSVAHTAIIAPPSLSAGDTYHLAFVTSTGRDATSSDIADYNSFVQGVADAAGIGSSEGVDWFAIASTTSVHAKDNAEVGGSSPVYLLDGTTKVVDDFADMWDGSLDNSIILNEFGTPQPWFVWTGTGVTGLSFPGFELGSGAFVIYGLSFNTNGGWIDDNVDPESTTYRFYALSEELTVLVPEPGALALSALGLLSLGGITWRRRGRA